MNIIHFIEKIFFIEIEFLEKISLPYFLVIYLIDVICIYHLCKQFKEEIWQAFIPLYNWRIIFKYCWNEQAYQQHVLLELLNILIPMAYENFLVHEYIELFLLVLDLIIAIMAIKHCIETMTFLLKSFGYEGRWYRVAMFFFNLPLIICAFGGNRYLYNASLAEESEDKEDA